MEITREYKELCKLRQEIGIRQANLMVEKSLYPSKDKEEEWKELGRKRLEIDQRLKEIVKSVGILFKK